MFLTINQMPQQQMPQDNRTIYNKYATKYATKNATKYAKTILAPNMPQQYATTIWQPT